MPRAVLTGACRNKSRIVVLADEGSFTKASRRLHIEQPSVSRAIQRLESQLGTALFLRTNRKVQLTTKGLELLAIARHVLSKAGEFAAAAADQENELSGAIKFAAESPLSFLWLPDTIEALAKDYPRLWPMMFTGVTDDLIRRIKARELEFGLFFYEGERQNGLEYHVVGHCQFQLVVARKLVAGGLNSFIGSREISDPKSLKLPTFDRLKRINKDLRIKYSANDLAAYRELLLKGLGIGLLPKAMVQADIRRGRLKAAYPELKLEFPVHLVHRQGEVLSLEARRLVEVFASSSGLR